MINTAKHLYYILRSSEEDVNRLLKNIHSSYYTAIKAKRKYGNNQTENGAVRYRTLHPSTGRLKVIQKRINRFLQEIKLPDFFYGSVKGKNNILNALKHRGNSFFLSVDIKDFFSGITHHQVFAMLRQNNFSPDVAHLLTKLVTYKGALPQGAPTSPVIANWVFCSTGLKLAQIAKRERLTFTTYLDDLVFSSKKDFKKLIPEILEEIKRGGFCIHNKKVTYKKFKPEVTGILIDKNHLTVNRIIKERALNNPFTRQYVDRVTAALKH